MENDTVFQPYNPFNSCFTALKIRYSDYDESLTQKHMIQKDSKLNVFINLESVFKFISMIHEMDRRLMVEEHIAEILISNILNLAEHYMRFLRNYGLDTKVYVYHTSFDSTGVFNESKYIEFFRSYYLVKFNNNPKFYNFTELMRDTVTPEVKSYCDFIPNLYYIEATDIEGSLVPYIIAQDDPTRLNLLITADFYETQYGEIPNFITHYIHRSVKERLVGSSPESYLQIITKKTGDELGNMMQFYQSYPFYSGLLAVLGERSRSMDGISGVGPKIFVDYVKDGIRKNKITESTTTPELIGDIFIDDDARQMFIQNYYCSNLLHMYSELTAAQKKSILGQRVDRSDNNTLQLINNGRFREYPIHLEGLLM